jgi:hypothetical protein
MERSVISVEAEESNVGMEWIKKVLMKGEIFHLM